MYSSAASVKDWLINTFWHAQWLRMQIKEKNKQCWDSPANGRQSQQLSHHKTIRNWTSTTEREAWEDTRMDSRRRGINWLLWFDLLWWTTWRCDMSCTESLSPVRLHSDQVRGCGGEGDSPHQFLMRSFFFGLRLFFAADSLKSNCGHVEKWNRLSCLSTCSARRRAAEEAGKNPQENLQTPHRQNGAFFCSTTLHHWFWFCFLPFFSECCDYKTIKLNWLRLTD